ncbi:MAG: PilZ domain-containing protein [Candidatus Omnitrophica bacterium]|nr:PilZ domain-containing protein [Candidatus Omnitrophota bacterium]
MAFGGPDRRLRARYKVRVPFVLRKNNQEIPGITRNVSLLGISAYASSSAGEVQTVDCYLNLPNRSQPLIAHGTVIRSEPLSEPHPDGQYEIGVFFKEFDGSGEAELSRFLQQVLQQEQSAIQAGYKVLKARLAARRRKKRLEEQRKQKKRRERLRKRKLRLARQKRLAAKKRGRGRPPKRS